MITISLFGIKIVMRSKQQYSKRFIQMKNLTLTILFSFVLLSCGGGSGQVSSAIEGIWRGELIHGGLFCADGAFISACAGCVAREVILEVRGEDILGSVVTVIDDECVLEGERTEDGFLVAPVSGCNVALESLTFRLLEEDNNAHVSYRYDIDKVETEPGVIACVSSPSGEVQR